MSAHADFIQALPKAELHIHIEGSLEPEMMFMLAGRNGVSLPYASVEEIKEAYNFSCLQDFLDVYYQGMSVLLTEQDFFDLTWAYLQRCRAQNVVHTEIFFDPQGHTSRGLPMATVIDGIWGALHQAGESWGLTSRLILCFLRHLDEKDAFRTLEAALPWRERLTGVGLDSSELGHPPSKFRRVFDEAGRLGLKRVAHAGEEGPPDYVAEALDLLQVDRIDHGNRALEDRDLVRRLASERIPLTVCPQSNLRLQVVRSMADHPLPAMLEAGLVATVNSDDPAYFGGYVNENFTAVTEATGLDREAIRQLVVNGFEASFLEPEGIARHVAAVRAVH